MNISDSGRVRSYLEKVLGMQETSDPMEAGLLGVIACSVRQKAIDKVVDAEREIERLRGIDFGMEKERRRKTSC